MTESASTYPQFRSPCRSGRFHRDGPVVDALLDDDLTVVVINPNQLKGLLRPDTPATTTLRTTVRARRNLVAYRVSLCNQLRAHLDPPRLSRGGPSARRVSLVGHHAARRSNRKPFGPTMTVEPSWPATPNGSGSAPNRSHSTKPVMNTAAITRFAVTTRRA